MRSWLGRPFRASATWRRTSTLPGRRSAEPEVEEEVIGEGDGDGGGVGAELDFALEAVGGGEFGEGVVQALEGVGADFAEGGGEAAALVEDGGGAVGALEDASMERMPVRWRRGRIWSFWGLASLVA
ncbi:hypothetical protein O0235_09295 [Tepidiforma flava]|uniref:Uncharacterized protein n=1 Tax=Tepidiforma flava TaxID=3004094 RepID=A0ABY7M2V6_9CHLR|nr:hypothetical protein [Tepidiforma flava]WBL34986.1 hypothetical protein O0235_09295 [Tepidiforma flava]